MNFSRTSSVIENHDVAGSFEQEIFDCSSPKQVIICSHGNGVRRWDGEHFFHAVAEHFIDSIVMLVDQNQPYKDGCKMNTLSVMTARVQELIDKAKTKYAGLPIVVMGHSMGCGIIAELDLTGVSKVIFVAPTAGSEKAKLLRRYGNDILNGQVVKTTDGLTKSMPKEYVDSVINIVWEDEYSKLLERYKPIYVFEAGAEEIVGDERLKHRDMSFTEYRIIEGAKHNFSGVPLQKLFSELDKLIP